MKNKKHGFSLIELLVGISISTILMIGLGILTINSIKTIILQKNIIENFHNIDIFSNSLDLAFDGKQTYLSGFGSGFLFKTPNFLNGGDFYYLGLGDKIQNCESEGYFLRYGFFSPFEGKFLEDSTDENKVYKLLKNIDIGDIFLNTANEFYANCYKNKICRIDKNSLKILEIIGNDDLKKTNNFPIKKEDISFNNPIGIAFGKQNLFVSNSFDNQILFLSGSNFFKIFDEFDGISNPKGLYFDDSKNILYISNSQKNEILSYKTNDFSTMSGSEFSVFKTGLNYPTGLYLSGNLIVSNNFLSREKIFFDNLGNIVKKENLGDFDTSFLQNKDLKVKSFSFDNSNGINTIKISFYTNFDCENPKNNKINEVIYKN